jgi:hypothetical protein
MAAARPDHQTTGYPVRVSPGRRAVIIARPCTLADNGGAPLRAVEDLMRQFLVFIVLATVAGCGRVDPLGPNFTDELGTVGGCGDITFFAVDDGDELMLTFRAEGLVANARAAGQETTTVLDLSANAAHLVLEQGTRISDATCDDVIENGGPQVSRSWVATAGTATVAIRPEPGRETATADLVLENVVLQSVRGGRVAFDRLEWMSIMVGWLAG